MNWPVRTFYKILPKSLIHFIGSRKFLKSMRDNLLRENGQSRTVIVNAHWTPENLDFQFKTNIKSSVRAEYKGIESSLLILSLNLLKYKNTPPDKVILDVGASFGYLSLVWGQTACQQGKVFSFEASRHVFDCLSYNVNANHLKDVIFPINRPVFSHSQMVVIDDSPSASHILVESNPDRINSAVKKKSISIDDFVAEQGLQKIALIKIDVDGVEFEILKGAARTLKDLKPVLIVESNNDQRIAQLLMESGYQLFDMDLKPFAGEMPNNLICLPE